MCLPAIAAVAGILGTAFSAYGAIQQGNAAKSAADFNAQNMAIMAADARKRGEAAAEAKQRETGALIGRQRAVMAARGLDLNQGSPLSILGDTAALGELDTQTIKGNAEREAVGYLNQGKLYAAEGQNAQSAGLLSAAGDVVGGIGSVASKWYQLKNPSAQFGTGGIY